MSRRSSFREQLERPGEGKAVTPDPSASPIEVRIETGERFRSPVSLAMLLRDHGLGLAGGHAAVTKMATYGRVEVTVLVSDSDDFIRRLTKMGLEAHVAHNEVSR